MPIHVSLNHKMQYRYDRPISLGPQTIRLRPAVHSRTPVLSYSLKVKPSNHFINWQQDPYGNFLARYVFPEKTEFLDIEVDLVADMTVINPFDFFLEESAEKYPFRYSDELKSELKPFLEKEKPGPLLTEYLRSVPRRGKAIIDFLVALNQRLYGDIRYLIRMEPGVQSCEETLSLRSGSCRDSAWLMVQILRHLGIAARFASGYLIQLTADVKALDGPSGPEKDFTDLHAWAEAYLPGAGWVGLDPTSGLLTGEGHIPLACSAVPTSAAPISGLVEKCESTFTHEMRVKRIYETPRVTLPYSPEVWQEIDAAGKKVEKVLQKKNIRLTMGGEPTFVSMDDMESAEWNTAALGQKKKELAGKLLLRLRDAWSKGGALLHYGQGKWYPGEELPRWSLTCVWRKDGGSVWKNAKLFAEPDRDCGCSDKDAEKLIHAIAAEMDIPQDFVIPAYEDAMYYVWRDKTLPVNVDPLDSKIENPLERKRLAAVFSRGLTRAAGFVLPLLAATDDKTLTIHTAPWYFKTKHLFLIPGDSPLGLRLPLGSLPWVHADDKRASCTRDPFDFAVDFKDDFETGTNVRDYKKPRQGQSDARQVSTALCVQMRGGTLHVFMPPVDSAEAYFALIRYVEAAAAKIKKPVVIEGYEPPFDPRLEVLKITPDPGVIEVNVPPSDSWETLVAQTKSLYAEARETRLGTEKFMLDGRHSGTGGGNHMVLGSAVPGDSPFLKRPDLLASFVRFWNNHPSLSYLFSGLFIGPTSQAPRVDEGRQDSLYELEIALRQVDRHNVELPWLVDRYFRHLLTDVTGNTHRAEICIDKLYSPDSATGRLGLVEFRAFEMPPHAEMSLVQQLLLRSLTAAFWQKPYQENLIRWGTRLHDLYMLPHFVTRDLLDVLAFLEGSGLPLKYEYFAPHVEFRFPLIGKVTYHDIEIELRQAIEPWYVLGEEATASGTSRYVDSSVERLQVKVKGLPPERFAVTCNQVRLPLQAAETAGESICGVRYRAWQPYSCLHPTIPVHTPLVFDVVDLELGKSVGGCTYHVAHPGGRNYGTFPVNANEAEARRRARFFKTGHTPGSFRISEQDKVIRDFACTLDLRRL